MKPVPTPRGTRPAPIDCDESRGAIARFCTRTVAGRTFSATPTTSGPVVAVVVALLVELAGVGATCPDCTTCPGRPVWAGWPGCGTTSLGPLQALSNATTTSACRHVRIPQRRDVIADAP